ncbi:DNA alkylation repair protein [Aquimarina hainanensis]|uniref:DNA alkylation repair protein n=1 Tax=Aquimarina hainanensis TaxID=1578017 RepID=A0ABW5NC03_9FLAO
MHDDCSHSLKKTLPDAIRNRKGPRKKEDIPKKVLELLNKGIIASVNLTEWLAVNHIELITSNFPSLGIPQQVLNTCLQKLEALKKPSTMNTIRTIGEAIYTYTEATNETDYFIDKLSNHPSDSIRCYTPYIIALYSTLRFEEKLDLARPLIKDPHFGVREVVWMALRPELILHIDIAIPFLSHWAKDQHEYIRRFTTEITRPRGVWCTHITTLKEHPEQGLPILSLLKSDTSIYVQDSVGNWLNDASKSAPDFVLQLCNEWNQTSPTKETKRIIKKALRTLQKK